MQQQNLSEQHRHENWFQQRYKQEKLPVTPPDDTSKKLIPTVQHDNLKMLTKKHTDEKLVITLLIVGAGLIAYHFW